MKDKKNHHGAVDKPSLEQQFCESAVITFVVWNFWSCTPSASGSYSRLAGRRNPETLNFSYADQNVRVFTLLQQYQCI